MGALSDSIGVSGGGITIEEADGTPSVSATVLKYPNNSLTVVGSTVSVDEYPAPLGVNGANLASFAPYLRAGYTFNDASGSLTDSVGVPHDMAQAGSSPTYLVPGKNGTAIDFSATTYFERPPQGFSPGTNEYTLNWWIKTAASNPTQCIFHWYAASGTTIALSLHSSGKLAMIQPTDNYSASTYPVGSWFMLTLQRVKDGGVYYNRVFMNGVQEINVADPVADLEARSLRIGGTYLDDAPDIIADELLYYTGPDGYGAISAAAILELYNSGTGIFLDTVGTPTGLGFSHADLVGYNSYLHDYWKFEESGTPLIDAISNNSLAATGSPTYGITGKSNNCVQFHQATSDYLSRTASFAHANDQEYSVSFWFYMDTLTASKYPVSFYIDNNNYEWFKSSVTGQIIYFRHVSPFSIQLSSAAGTFSTGAWNHIAIVKTKSAGPLFAVSIYFNATLVGTETPVAASSHLPANTSTMLIGKSGHSSLSEHLDGKVDELAYWKGVSLDSAAVTALYNAGSGRFLESI